jgi:hypothetical protein
LSGGFHHPHDPTRNVGRQLTEGAQNAR